MDFCRRSSCYYMHQRNVNLAGYSISDFGHTKVQCLISDIQLTSRSSWTSANAAYELASKVVLIYHSTHWDRVTQKSVSKFTINSSDSALSPIRHQVIIWTNAGILLIRTLRTNFSETVIQIHTFSNKKMHLKMSSGKCRPFCLGLNVF